MSEIIIGLTTTFLLILGGIWGYTSERKRWNLGVCRENGIPWERFDTDSQGGRGYVAGDIYTWISWPVDKALQPQEEEGDEP